jgi:hypothetical protein
MRWILKGIKPRGMINALDRSIHVTRLFVPPMEQFCQEVREIWKGHWLTNDGPILTPLRQICLYAQSMRRYPLLLSVTTLPPPGCAGGGRGAEVVTTGGAGHLLRCAASSGSLSRGSRRSIRGQSSTWMPGAGSGGRSACRRPMHGGLPDNSSPDVQEFFDAAAEDE